MSPKNTLSSPLRDVFCGLLSGLSTSLILQPMDKALYLGMKYHRPFFDKENWRRPYHAMGQTLFYRATSNALYFPIEQWSRNYFNSNLIGGIVAGGMMSTILNPMSVIRFQCWLYHTSFKQEVYNLYYGRGFKNFSKGLIATLIRDIVFGASYSSARHWKHDNNNNNKYNYIKEFIWNGICALGATTLSSPFNYIRNIQFATPPNKKPLSIINLSKEIIYGYKKINGY